MWNDPIIEEVHRIRKQLLARAKGNLRKAIDDAAQRIPVAGAHRSPRTSADAVPHPALELLVVPAAHAHARTAREPHEVVVPEVRFHLAHPCDVHDRRAMDAHEGRGVE